MERGAIRLVLQGAAGRMGREIARAVSADEGFRLVGAIERPGHPQVGRDLFGVTVGSDLRAALTDAEVVIDFSLPEGTAAAAAAAAAVGSALVSGVTGLGAEPLRALERAAERIPVVYAPNMSRGIALLELLIRDAARRLPADYDIELVEMHHRGKRDAPSGTAERLVHLLQEARPELEAVYGRRGAGARASGEIGVHAVRGGGVVGEHRVLFAGQGERVELIHRAEDRFAFVGGVLAAARFVRGRAPGLYSMADVLGVSISG
jgi:4-hydroxy-tetrahydrodipicolinate reductase